MAKIRHFLLRNFEEEPKDNNLYNVEVPKGSKLLSCKPVPTGIMVWYEVPVLDTFVLETETFKMLDANEDVPTDAEFITIIDIVSEHIEGQTQSLLILPIYKILPKEIKIHYGISGL